MGEIHPGEVGDFLVVQADRDELGQALALLVQHPQRAVAGTDQLHRGGHDPPQHHRQVQFAADRQHRIDQGLHPPVRAGEPLDLLGDLL